MITIIDQLPEPYRTLAKLRAKQCTAWSGNKNRLGEAFDWGMTSEGHNFWRKIDSSPQSSWYPVPEDSLMDLSVSQISPTILTKRLGLPI